MRPDASGRQGTLRSTHRKAVAHMLYFAVTCIVVVAIYALIGAALFFGQRRLQYRPETIRTLPGAIGLPQAVEHVITTADAHNIIVWKITPRPGFPIIVFLPGSHGALRLHVDRFRHLTADGTGLLALSYRGFGGSSGSPTERGLIEDARSLWDHATTYYPLESLVLWGYSLGTAVAIALAAQRPVRRLIVEGSFVSAAAIAQHRYPMFPARWCLLDKFDCGALVTRVKAPILMLHGAADKVVPISEARQLFDLATSRKKLVIFPEGGHEDLFDHGVTRSARAFLEDEGCYPLKIRGFA
jgi:uncharacterized protein